VFRAVTRTLFAKPDFGPWRIGWWLEKWEQFLINIAQSGIVLKKRFVDLGQTFQDGIVGSEHFALLNESPDHVNTHGYGLRTV